MDFDPVDSTMIAALGYDPQTSELGVRFKSGKTLTYAGVPPDTYEALRSAQSIGRQFNATIAGQYEAV